MEGDEYEEETYIRHLRSMFDDLDSDNKGGLNREQLKALGEKLSLQENQSDLLLQFSFGTEGDLSTSQEASDGNEHVDFNKFQESFVAVLSVTADLQMSHSESEEDDQETTGVRDFNDNESMPVSEVKPRVVRGDRAYGRRSHPDVFDSEVLAGCKEVGINRRTSEVTSDAEDNVFDNGFYELPERKSSRLYFEASGLMRNPSIDRLKQKSLTNLNESQNNTSMSSAVYQVHHLFGDIDREEVGLIDYTELCDMWKNEGVLNPRHVLQVLDVSVDSDKQVNAYDLTSVLESEAASLGLSSADSVLQAVLATYKHQMTHLNGQVEQQQVLLGKMKDDLEKSELRNSKLVDEVDDRYLNVDKNQAQILSNAEKQWSRKLRQAKKNFEKDRELLQAQAMRERDVLQQEIDRLTIREESLRSTINALQLDNDALEQESRELVQKLQQSDCTVARLQKDLECLLNEKVTGLNDPHNTSQEERFAVIIKEYEAQCRSLSDRNDELVAELEKARSEFLHSMREQSRIDESDIDVSEGKASSRKRARRRGSDIYADKECVEDESNDEDEVAKVNLCKKISELEKANQEIQQERAKLVKEMQEERAKLTTRFAQEKSMLRDQLESEFRSKLEEERKNLMTFQEMTKTDKDAAIGQALADGKKQIEELERRVSELRAALEDEQRNSQKSFTDLCREFESDKIEMQKSHDEKLREISEKGSNAERQLQEEIKLHQSTQQQLQADRRQHEANLRTHSETITRLEKCLKNTGSKEDKELFNLKSRISSLEGELVKKEDERKTIIAIHEKEREKMKDEVQKKVDEMLALKQQEAQEVACEDLRNIQQRVASEREDMKRRITDLKNSFELEAEEMRTLLQLEKNEFQKLLSEESKSLKRKLMEESEKELNRKQQQIENKHKKERDAQISILEETISTLKRSKNDLEDELMEAVREKNEYKKELKKDDSLEISRLQHSLDEKDGLLQVLHNQVEEMREKHVAASEELGQIKVEYERRNAELSQLMKEKEEYSERLSRTKEEMSACQVVNAQLTAKNIELGKSFADAEIEEKEEQIAELQSKVKAAENECSQFKEELRTIRSEKEALSNRGTAPKEDIQSKYDSTRNQLLQQMKKTKEMYSELARSETLIKELYCENAQLMRALQTTEERHKECQRKIIAENDKNHALTTLLRKICPEAV